MNHTQLNEFVYALHNKMESVETWAATVNEAVTDHAERIDIIKASAFSAFTGVKAETDSIRASIATAAATAEHDTREVMRIVEANDLALKEKIEALISMMSTEIEKGKSEAATAVGSLAQTVDTRVREMQQQQGSQPSAGSSTDAQLRAVVEDLHNKFLQHEQNTSHVLDAGATMARFVALETAVSALSAATQQGAPATEERPKDPWHAAARDLRSRFDAATSGGASGMSFGGEHGKGGGDDGGWGKGFGGTAQQQQQQETLPPQQQQQRPAPPTFNMGRFDSAERLRLDVKLARIDKHFYTDAAPETWHQNIRTYMIGVHADMMPFLTWIESHGKREIKWDDLQRCARESEVMMSLDPLQVAHEMWSWLNLTLEKSSSAQRTFRNVGELNGCEVYRRLVTPLGITKPSVTRRGVLRDKVQQPLRAKSMLSVMDAVEAWEENKLVYSKAGGTAHDDEEERAQLYKILPDNISQDMLSHAHDQPTADALIDWMREKETFLK